MCVLWHVGKWCLFAVDKQAIYHHAIFAFRFLSIYFISACWSSLNRAKGLGEVSSESWGGSLSSKSITITQCIYPPGTLVCLAPLCLQWPWAMCVYLLLLGGETLEGIEKCRGGLLFLTAGAWPWSLFSLPLPLLYWSVLYVLVANRTMCWLGIGALPPSSTPRPVHLHAHVLINGSVTLFHLFCLPPGSRQIDTEVGSTEKENTTVRRPVRVK